MSEQFPPREDVPSHRRQIVHTCFKCGGIGHKQRDCHKSRESPKDRNEERYIPREADVTARQELHDHRSDHQDQRSDLRQQMPRDRDGRQDSTIRTVGPIVDGPAAWTPGGGSFPGAPIRAGVPVMGMGHSHVPVLVGQPMLVGQSAHEHQQRIQDLSYQIERIQQIMNELNQLRLPNEIMLQLSDYITHLRKELHRLNLAVQSAPIGAPLMNSVGMEPHAIMREPSARDATRGDANVYVARQESRRDRARGERPPKRHWGQAETVGPYIERETFVNEEKGTD